MKVQKSLAVAHTSSVLISIMVNGLLLLALLTLLSFSESSIRESGTVMVIDPVPREDVEIPEDEIEPEEVMDPEDLNELMDFTLDQPMETHFEPEQEVVDNLTQTEISTLSELMSDVSSPVLMSGLLVGRTPAARQAAMARYGKGLEKFSEPAVMKALEWLRDHQAKNGAWNGQGNPNHSGGNTGYTGLALLTFLAHGETPTSVEFGPTVAKGIRFIVENQDAAGVFRPAGGNTVYGHAIATYAIAEAYTMTQNILLLDPLKRAVKVMIEGQMPNGGYNYEYKKEERNDLSVAAWHVQALKAAAIALPEDQEVKQYLQSAMDGMMFGSTLDGSGARGFAYGAKGTNAGQPRSIVSAAGTLALYLSGRGHSIEAKESVKFIERYTKTDRLPLWGREPDFESGGHIMHWYYTIQSFFHEDPDGTNFNRYMPAMVKALVQHQAEDGHWRCYSGGEKHGPVFNTTLAALSLMVYYRHLPTTQAEHIQPPTVAPAIQKKEGEEVEFFL